MIKDIQTGGREKKKKRLARQLVLFGAAVGDQSLPFRRDEQKPLIHILASS